MILGIDTSADQCAVALVDGDRVWRRAEVMARGHAEALFPMIDDVLAEAGASMADVTRVAVCTGPGSFTGIRAGVAAARGLALGLGVPAVGVSRLAALSVGAGRAGTVALALRGETVAVQGFDGKGHETGPARLADTMPQAPEVIPAVAEGGLADPVIVARLGALSDATERPAPLYLRPADAAPSSEAPPALLD